jgi:hypothetical protein
MGTTFIHGHGQGIKGYTIATATTTTTSTTAARRQDPAEQRHAVALAVVAQSLENPLVVLPDNTNAILFHVKHKRGGVHGRGRHGHGHGVLGFGTVGATRTVDPLSFLAAGLRFGGGVPLDPFQLHPRRTRANHHRSNLCWCEVDVFGPSWVGQRRRRAIRHHGAPPRGQSSQMSDGGPGQVAFEGLHGIRRTRAGVFSKTGDFGMVLVQGKMQTSGADPTRQFQWQTRRRGGGHRGYGCCCGGAGRGRGRRGGSGGGRRGCRWACHGGGWINSKQQVKRTGAAGKQLMVEMGVGSGLRQLMRGVLVLVVPFQQVGLCGSVVDGKDARRPSRGGGQLRGSDGRVIVGRETEEWYCDPGHCWRSFEMCDQLCGCGRRGAVAFSSNQVKVDTVCQIWG